MSTLSPERWRALSPYLDKALTLSKSERAVWFAGLLAENPANSVAEVGFSTAVGSNDGGDPRAVEPHFGFFKEGLEALNFDPLQFEQNTCPFLLSSRGDG